MLKIKEITKRRSQTGYPGVYKTPGAKTFYFSTYATSDPYITKRTNHAGYETAEDAFLAKKEFELRMRKEQSIVINKHTIGNLVAKYLYWRKEQVKLSTYHHTEGLIVKYLSEPYEKWDIEKFCRSANLEKFRKTILAATFSAEQKNRIFGLVRKTFDYGVKARICSMHYYDTVSFKLTQISKSNEVKPKKKENYWTIEEWRKFINCFEQTDRWFVLFTLLGHLGCRVGELRGLQNKHIDLINRKITIEQQALNNVGTGKSEIGTPKTRTSRRTITISNSMKELLEDYMIQIKAKNPEKFLFFNSEKPLGVSSIRRKFNAYSKIAGIKKITLHGIRHSNCTWLLANELNIMQIGQISERLGHASTRETLGTYMHVHKKEDPTIMETLEGAITKKDKGK